MTIVSQGLLLRVLLGIQVMFTLLLSYNFVLDLIDPTREFFGIPTAEALHSEPAYVKLVEPVRELAVYSAACLVFLTRRVMTAIIIFSLSEVLRLILWIEFTGNLSFTEWDFNYLYLVLSGATLYLMIREHSAAAE
ncbi:hypothetical protein [Maricaulis parjimensis]|uniref:hypothetical protein n=1 Tax=Maricaulis parjimensis TaxID=144023 RepID=UPI00193AD547|nr:hypothetical protein [Maricaulis parjimensis]